MSDIVILHEMIKDEAKLCLSDGHDQKKCVTLMEPQQKGYSPIIRGISNSTIVIKADNFKSPDTVFNGLRGECKRADFVIITNMDNRGKFIIYIEMKEKTQGARQEIIQQLTGAKCFVAYCREIGRTFWNEQTFLKDYEERFVSIRHISISKQKMRRAAPTGIHDSPDNILTISSLQEIQLNHLIGRVR